MASVEIYCPRCEWHPSDEDRWVCFPGCDTTWNTFLTRGLCPGCGKRWSVTQCHRCLALSPHEDGYHYPQESTCREIVEETASSPAGRIRNPVTRR